MTLLAFRQRAQTYTRRGVPASSMRTFWRLGLKRRRVATIEWLRELPNAGPLPQLKHTLAMAADGSGGTNPGRRPGRSRASAPAAPARRYSDERSSAMRITAWAASRPWSRLSPPARAKAWSIVSAVITPNAQGTPVDRATSWMPRAASLQTCS